MPISVLTLVRPVEFLVDKYTMDFATPSGLEMRVDFFVYNGRLGPRRQVHLEG